MKRKGQFIDLITVSVLLFIITGSLLGAFTINKEISDSVDHNIGDTSEIAETEMKSQFFDTRIRKELNYTSNIVALNLSERSGDADIDWSEIDEKSDAEEAMEDLMGRYNSFTASKLETQAKIAGRCNNKQIEEVWEGGENSTVLNVEFEDKWVRCSDDYTDTKVKLPEGKELEVNNSDNRYVPLVNYTVGFASRIPERIPDSINDTGHDDGSECPETRSTEVDEAESNAEENAKDVNSSLAEGIFDKEDSVPGWLKVSTDTSFSGRVVPGSVDVTPTECTYDCPEDGEEGSCSEGTRYSVTADYEISSTTLSYQLKDDGRSVVNSSASDEKIVFGFEDTYDVGE